jgi:hypothetical protein
MKRITTLLALLLLLAFALTGCISGGDQTDQTDNIISTVHKGFQSGNWDPLMPLYSEKFLRSHAPDQWRKRLSELTRPLGTLKHIKSTFQQNNPRLGGVVSYYGFQLQFEHGTVAETLILFNNSDKQQVRITGHELRITRQAS